MNPLKVEKIGEVVNADAIHIRLLNYLSANFQTPWEQKSNQGEINVPFSTSPWERTTQIWHDLTRKNMSKELKRFAHDLRQLPFLPNIDLIEMLANQQRKGGSTRPTTTWESSKCSTLLSHWHLSGGRSVNKESPFLKIQVAQGGFPVEVTWWTTFLGLSLQVQ